MLQLAGADRVLTMDLHAGQIQGFFTIPVDHMTALPLFARHFRDLGLPGRRSSPSRPTPAGPRWHRLRGDDPGRLRDHEQDAARPRPAAVTEITGRVRDKVALVGDDVIMTGGTLLAGAKA